jgi:hypothetical protein
MNVDVNRITFKQDLHSPFKINLINAPGMIKKHICGLVKAIA